MGGVWRNYFYLRGVRRENRELREEIQRLRLEQVRMAEDAGQARRLQALLSFKEQFISETLPAQVISTTGSDFSRAVYIDKGAQDGLRPDMPVITPEGVVGKVFRVYPSSSLVLLISDPSSGVGVILEKTRLQGILKGAASGETVLQNVMSDERVNTGEPVLTSGGDRVFPKGLAVGTVAEVGPGSGLFLRVRIKPAARLERLEEVLVITRVEEKGPSVDDLTGPVRAVDILARRLPSVPRPSEESGTNKAAGSSLPAPTVNLPAIPGIPKTANSPVPSKPPVPSRDKAPELSAGSGTAKQGSEAVSKPGETRSPVSSVLSEEEAPVEVSPKDNPR
jgi:rod shape-determining protein MreC